MGEEKKMDKTKEEAQIARLAIVVVGDTRAQVEDDMARV